MKLYHGSASFIETGTKLNVSKNLKDEIFDEVEKIFEYLKPKDKISRFEAVYACEKIDDIDPCGGYTDVVYEIESSRFEMSDLAWLTEAKIAYENNDIDAVKRCANNYWNSVLFYNKKQSCIEYRARDAVVLRIVEINDCESNQSTV